MTRVQVAVVATLVAATATVIRADVHTDQKTHVEFAGALGRVVNIFGGKAAREGVVSSIAVKGDREARMTGQTGQIVDLNEEKIYDLDLRNKTYKVTTFDELRRQMQEAEDKAQQQADKAEGGSARQAAPEEKEKEVVSDVQVKNTGETKTINGFHTHESIVTVTTHEKGKKIEDSGGMITTADLWLAPKIAAMDEITAFAIRYAQKLYGPMLAGLSPAQVGTAAAMYPLMKQALSRVNPELQKLDGSPIMTTLTFDNVKSKADMDEEARQKREEQQQAENKDDDSGGGLGGLLGGFAKRAASKRLGGDSEPQQRSTVLTSTTEILKVSTTVAAADLEIPAGFRQVAR
jgi:hypothetical protein